MTQLYEVTYTVRGVISAESEVDAKSYAIKQFMEIVDCHSYEESTVEPLPVKHNWVECYVPFGNNSKGLTVWQIEQILGSGLGGAA